MSQQPPPPETKGARAVRVLKYADGEGPLQGVELLKALFDRIVTDCGISKLRWGKLANSFISERAKERGLGESVNLVEERSSLNKNFVTQKKMSLRSFCRAMQFLRARRFRLSVTIEHASGQLTEHGLWVNVNTNLSAEADLDDDLSVPVEVSVNHGALPNHERLHVPPPDLRKYASQYPAPTPEPKGPDSGDVPA